MHRCVPLRHNTGARSNRVMVEDRRLGLIVSAVSSSLVILALSLDINTYSGIALDQLEKASARLGSSSKTCVSVADPDELSTLFDKGEWSTSSRIGIGSSSAPGDVHTCSDRVKSSVGTDMLLAHAHALKFASENCKLDGIDREYVEIAKNASQAALLGYRVSLHEKVVFMSVQSLSSCRVPSTCPALYPDVVRAPPRRSSLDTGPVKPSSNPENFLRIECGKFNSGSVYYMDDWTLALDQHPPTNHTSQSNLLELCISQFSVDSAARRGALGVPVPQVPVSYNYNPVRVSLSSGSEGTSRSALALAGARAGFCLWVLVPATLFSTFLAAYFIIFFVRIATSEVGDRMSGISEWNKSFSISAASLLLLLVISLRVYFVWIPMSSTQAPSRPYCESDGSGWRSFRSATWAEIVSTSGYCLALALPAFAMCLKGKLVTRDAWNMKCGSCPISKSSILLACVVSLLYITGTASEAILGSTIGSAWATTVSSSLFESKELSLRLALMLEDRASSAISFSATTGVVFGTGASLAHMLEFKRDHIVAFRAMAVLLVLAALIPLLNVPSIRAIFTGSDLAHVDKCRFLDNHHHFVLCEWQWVVSLLCGSGIAIVAVGVSAFELVTSRKNNRSSRGDAAQRLLLSESSTGKLPTFNSLQTR
jgi:hypothetical protein